VLLVAPGDDEASRTHRASLAERFDPDVIAVRDGDGPGLREIRPGSTHSFSDDLAMLVSTSGSTGSPKLVRLSRQNLLSNAQAIAAYLRITPADRAATTLPMHYCYGLSVLNSHLVSKASVVLTERSVADATFWVETPAVLRALAIVLIVGTHADLITVQGGAHLLLAVAGYNLARFQLADVARATRVRRLLKSAAQIAIPATLWIGTVAVFTGKYTWTTALLVNNLVPGDGKWNEQWQFWFLEAAVWTMLGFAAMFLIRPIDRLERRHPWTFPVVLFAAAVTTRFALVGIEAEGIERYTPVTVLWSLVLGWVIARADNSWKCVAASAAAIVATIGFFGDPAREAVVVAGILLLIWVERLRMPRALVPAVRLLASASLFIYLTHWVVYPTWEASAPWFGTVSSLTIGVAA
jgi:hypothetical protein